MSWILVAILGYVSAASAGIIDKFLVSDRIGKPWVYAFFVSIFSLVSFLFAPLGLRVLDSESMGILLLSGISFLWGLFFLYRSLQYGEVSAMAPIVGVSSAVVAIIPSVVHGIFEGDIPVFGLASFLLLLSGAILVVFPGKDHVSFEWRGVWYAVVSGILLSFFYFLLKQDALSDAGFVNRLVWSRFGMFLGGISLLFVPIFRRDIVGLLSRAAHRMIRRSEPEIPRAWSTSALFLLGKTLGGVSAFLLVLSVSYQSASVAIVQALIGVQFAGIFLGAVFLSRFFPRIFSEKLSRANWYFKCMGFLLVSLGAWFASKGGEMLF